MDLNYIAIFGVLLGFLVVWELEIEDANISKILSSTDYIIGSFLIYSFLMALILDTLNNIKNLISKPK